MSAPIDLYRETLAHLLGPVQPFLADPSVTEVMINGPDEIYIERAGRLERTDACFTDDDSLRAALRNIAQFVGKRLIPEQPSLEARLPDGSRVHIVQPPAARKGLCATIRKFSDRRLSLADLVTRGTLTPAAAEFLGLGVALEKNIIVSGGTGSGKTTLLNVLSSMIPATDRIIVLEDSTELQLQQPHVLPFEVQAPDRHGRGGMTIRDLFRASLRMRPDRIVVGECRGGEALDMIQAMTSGHSGSLSTCHANTPKDALNRLETMALMAGMDIPLVALRAQVGSAIDLIVQIDRIGAERRVTCISEVGGLTEAGTLAVTDLFRYGGHPPSLLPTGVVPSFTEQLQTHGLVERVADSRQIWGLIQPRGDGK